MRWTATPDTDHARSADLPSPLWEVYDEDGDLVAGGFTEEQAKLCAAAPDLLAALESLLAEFGARLSDGKPLGYTVGAMERDLKIVRDAEAAIVKARGEEE